MYSKVLECVDEKVVCVTAGTEQCFENGKAAIAHYEAENGKFDVKKIGVKDGVLTIVIEDISDEIKAANEKFVKEYKEQNGTEPSFF